MYAIGGIMMVYIDAWWFNNIQEYSEVIQPDFFTPTTHYGIYAELHTISLPFMITYTALSKKGLVLYLKDFNIVDSGEYEDFEIEVAPKIGIFIFKALADNLPELPASINVTYKDSEREYTETVACHYSTLHGRITDFSGNEFQAPLLLHRIAFDGKHSYMGTWSNSNGEYSITVPNGTYNAFYIDDKSYGKTTLECWGWHMIVDKNEQLDFKIGNGEVYSLHAWPSNGGYSTLFIYFRPMILPSLKNKNYKINLDDEFSILDISPDLRTADLSISINGIHSEIISVQRIFETGYSNCEKKAMPAYIVQIKRSNHSTIGKQTLVVEYDTQKSKLADDNIILAQSQGYLQFYYHSGGTCIK